MKPMNREQLKKDKFEPKKPWSPCIGENCRHKSHDNSNKEEWGGWKIVAEMLDNPDELGIYQTSKCYQKLYEFVVSQKAQSRQQVLEEVRQIAQQRRNNELWRGISYVNGKCSDCGSHQGIYHYARCSIDVYREALADLQGDIKNLLEKLNQLK